MKIKGRNLILFILRGGSWAAYAGARSCTLEVTQETAEVLPGPADDWRWRSYAPTRWGWTMHADGLMTLYEDPDLPDPVELLEQYDEPVRVCMDLVGDHPEGKPEGGFTATGLRPRWGSAYVTQVEETGEYEDMATLSMDFQGSGPLWRTPLTDVDANLWLDPEAWDEADAFEKAS